MTALEALERALKVPVGDRTKFLSDHSSGCLTRVFAEYLPVLEMRHICCAPQHPNGKIERFHETLKTCMNLLVYTSEGKLFCRCARKLAFGPHWTMEHPGSNSIPILLDVNLHFVLKSDELGGLLISYDSASGRAQAPRARAALKSSKMERDCSFRCG